MRRTKTNRSDAGRLDADEAGVRWHPHYDALSQKPRRARSCSSTTGSSAVASLALASRLARWIRTRLRRGSPHRAKRNAPTGADIRYPLHLRRPCQWKAAITSHDFEKKLATALHEACSNTSAGPERHPAQFVFLQCSTRSDCNRGSAFPAEFPQTASRCCPADARSRAWPRRSGALRRPAASLSTGKSVRPVHQGKIFQERNPPSRSKRIARARVDGALRRCAGVRVSSATCSISVADRMRCRFGVALRARGTGCATTVASPSSIAHA